VHAQLLVVSAFPMVTSLFNTDIQCQLETACQLLAFGRMYACCLDVMQAYIRAHAVSYAKPQVEHEGGKANLARQKSWRWPTLRLSPPSSIFASSPPTYMHAAFWFLVMLWVLLPSHLIWGA